MVFILENLALGNIGDAENPPSEITAFLNVADDVELYKPVKKYYKIPLQDGSRVPVEMMLKAINWIDKNIILDKILVFCRYGAGRSVSVVIGYLCSIGFDYTEAVKFVASKKRHIDPLPLLAETIKIALKQKERFI
ncbi:MAG: dual specificity protein phosphatase [bacterium]|nr:dual specificity protein phosphatase [bacterium]